MLIETSKLTKNVVINSKEKHTILFPFSYNFPNTGLVSICGESGSGKSTLLNILSLMDNQFDGKYFFDGVDIKKLSYKKKRRLLLKNIGIVFQSYHLFENQSVIFNVMLPSLMVGDNKHLAKEKATKLLKSININDELFNKKTSLLSGGEKQRIAVLRSLINNPRVLFADEPTGALDSENSTLIMEMFKDFAYMEFSFSGTGLRILFKSNVVINDYAKKEKIKYDNRK